MRPIYRMGVPLHSRCCILYIFFSTNVRTEYFKHAAHSTFFSSKCRLFRNAIFFGSCVIHILHTVVLKLNVKFGCQKVNVLPLCHAGCGSYFVGEFFLCCLLCTCLDCFKVKWCLFWSVVPFFASCLKCNFIIKLLCLTGNWILYEFEKHNRMTNVKII